MINRIRCEFTKTNRLGKEDLQIVKKNNVALSKYFSLVFVFVLNIFYVVVVVVWVGINAHAQMQSEREHITLKRKENTAINKNKLIHLIQGTGFIGITLKNPKIDLIIYIYI